MKNKTLEKNTEIVEFNDNKLEHVLAGPDYGQPWGNWNGWIELDEFIMDEGFDLEENVSV